MITMIQGGGRNWWMLLQEDNISKISEIVIGWRGNQDIACIRTAETQKVLLQLCY